MRLPCEVNNTCYSFLRTYRLIASNDFTKVIKKAGCRINSRKLTLLAIKNDTVQARLGIIVGKKKVRKANKRNTIKRVIRESFRHNQQNLKGFDIVVIAKNELAWSTKIDIRECLEELWKKFLKVSNG